MEVHESAQTLLADDLPLTPRGAWRQLGLFPLFGGTVEVE